VRLGPILLVLSLGVDIFALIFLYTKITKVQRSQRQIIGLLLKYGWPKELFENKDNKSDE